MIKIAIIIKSRLPDLNQQHLDLQSNALPNWAKAGKWVRPDLNRSLRLPKPKGSTKLPYGPNNIYTTYLFYITIIYKCFGKSYGLIDKSYKWIKSYQSKHIKPRTGIEPATTRLQVSRSTRLSHRGN